MNGMSKVGLLVLVSAMAAVLACAPVMEHGVPAKEGSGLQGTVVRADNNQPVQGAYVYAYRRLGSNLMGPSDYLSGETDAAGNYRFLLPPGKYYLVARKRVSGDNTGPLTSGDYYSEQTGIPVEVPAQGFKKVDFQLVKRDEPMFFSQVQQRIETDTGIKGILVDADGNPVPGAFAIAYSTPDIRRLAEHTSTVTASDGAFTLYLPKGGKYFLAARSGVRERPQKGELYGTYDETPDHHIVVPDQGFMTGVRIVMTFFEGPTLPGKPY